MGHPHLLRGPFCSSLSSLCLLILPSLLKPNGKLCPSQALGLPEVWAVGSHCFQISLSQGPQGKVQEGCFQLCLGCGLPGQEGARSLGACPSPWGTCSQSVCEGRRGGTGGSLTRGDRCAPCLSQPWPPATTWTCGMCKTCPSQTPGGILGTVSCRLETGELMPQVFPALQSL